MKCKIRWIDENGKPTDDENDAICVVYVQAHDWNNPHNGQKVHIPESERFPCCAKHAEQLTGEGMENWIREDISI